MPTSWYQAIPSILDKVQYIYPQSILDIGVGFGKYGVLFREALELPYLRYHKSQWKVVIDGIEAFPEYHNPIYDFVYNEIFYGDVKDLIKYRGVYDVITMIDVIEHFEKEVGKTLIDELLLHCRKGLIISTPLDPAPQKEYLGNFFEEHKSVWVEGDFKGYPHTTDRISIAGNVAQIFTVTL